MASGPRTLDGQRFPSVARYLDRLPGGLAAYPHWQGKASLLRSVLDTYPLHESVPYLPDTLAELIRFPPPTAHWIPEVHFRALMRVVLDAHFRSPAAFIAWSYSAQQRMLGGALYRVLFALISPERVARGAPGLWANFHRGSTLTIDLGRQEGTVTMTYPEHTQEELDQEATLAGLRVAVELSGGRGVRSTTLELGPTQSKAQIIWR